MALGIALIHAQQVRAEECRLVAAGARAYLDDNVLVIVGVLGQQHYLQLLDKLLLQVGKLVQLLMDHFLHLGVKVLLQHGLAVLGTGNGGGVFVERRNYFLKLAVLLYHLTPCGLVIHCVGLGQALGDLFIACFECFKLVYHIPRSNL